MKSEEVVIGGKYIAKVSNNLTVIQITELASPRGWWGRNLKTGREVRIKTARKLRRAVSG